MRALVPTRAFLFLGPSLGLVVLCLTPPFQAPDEFNIFYRSYMVASGDLIARQPAGAAIPTSLYEATAAFQSVPFHPERKVSRQMISSALGVPMATSKTMLPYIPNTALYAPLAFLPQAAGIDLGRIVGLGPLGLHYMSRLVNLLVWLLLVSTALRITPVAPWLFFLVSLTPMSIFMAASSSPDAPTNGACELFIAALLRCIFGVDPQRIGKRWISALLLLSVSVGLLKVIYAPIALLGLCIPSRKFKSSLQQRVFVAALLITSFGAAAIWSWLGAPPPTSVRAALDASLAPTDFSFQAQLQQVVAHPLRFLTVCLRTLKYDGAQYVVQYIGTLGWLDTPLPSWLWPPYLGAIVLTATTSKGVMARVGVGARSLMLLIFVGVTGLILLSQYLVWTRVGSPTVEGPSGRYFIPVAPLLFLCVYRRTPGLDLDESSWSYAPPLLALATTACVAIVLLNRYWITG